MLLSLEQILRVVAKSKGISNSKKWIEDRLNHAEISSNYYNYIHLKSNKRMWFGVRDAKFECQPFILFREYENNDSLETVKEFELFTFTSFQDKTFLELLKDSYVTHYDIIMDFRVFFETQPVMFDMRGPDGKRIKLKEYNDLDEGFTILTNLYQLTVQGLDKVFYFCSRDLLEIQIINLCSFNQGVNVEKSSESREVYLTDNMEVMRSEERQHFELTRTKEGFEITWS